MLRDLPTLYRTAVFRLEQDRVLQRIVFVALCGLCIGLLFIRRPDAFMYPQFYAEDGMNYFADAYNAGWSSLFNRAHGYFHVFPRLVDLLSLSVGIPLVWIPAMHSLACLGLYVALWHSLYYRFPSSVVARTFAMVATVLAPQGTEIWMNTTNVQWPMALLMVQLMIGEPARSGGATFRDVILLVLCGLTGPLALVLGPAMLLFYFTQKERMKRGGQWRVPVLITCAMINAIALIQYGSVSRMESDVAVTFQGFVQVVFFQFWHPILSTGVHQVPTNWMGVLVLLFVLAAVYFLLAHKHNKRLSLFYVLCGLTMITVTLYSYRAEPTHLSPFYRAARNFYLPVVFGSWAFIAISATISLRRFLVMVVIAAWWTVQSVFVVGPSVFKDLDWPSYAARATAGEELEVPIIPVGWSMHLDGKGGAQ